jgi:uncharacterized membrane protein YbaN (DUF454 family)
MPQAYRHRTDTAQWRHMSSDPTPPHDASGLARPLSALARAVYLALALLFLGLGILGAFLPVLPTTPFILLSAWAAARSSPRLLHWLEHHTAFGPMIRDWRRGGVVSRKAKWMSSGFMAASGAWLLWSSHPRWAAWAAIGCMSCVAIWLWRRPEQFPADPSPR